MVEGILGMLILGDFEKCASFYRTHTLEVPSKGKKEVLSALEEALKKFLDSASNLMAEQSEMNPHLYLAINARRQIGVRLYAWMQDERISCSCA